MLRVIACLKQEMHFELLDAFGFHLFLLNFLDHRSPSVPRSFNETCWISKSPKRQIFFEIRCLSHNLSCATSHIFGLLSTKILAHVCFQTPHFSSPVAVQALVSGIPL